MTALPSTPSDPLDSSALFPRSTFSRFSRREKKLSSPLGRSTIAGPKSCTTYSIRRSRRSPIALGKQTTYRLYRYLLFLMYRFQYHTTRILTKRNADSEPEQNNQITGRGSERYGQRPIRNWALGFDFGFRFVACYLNSVSCPSKTSCM